MCPHTTTRSNVFSYYYYSDTETMYHTSVPSAGLQCLMLLFYTIYVSGTTTIASYESLSHHDDRGLRGMRPLDTCVRDVLCRCESLRSARVLVRWTSLLEFV
jgi:hypothetical protein